MNTSTRKRHKGFSLPEMMMAIVLFGVGFTMAMGMFSTGVKHHSDARRAIMGSVLCENGLAEAVAGLRHVEDAAGNLTNPFDAPAGNETYLAPPLDTDLVNLEYTPSYYDDGTVQYYDKGCLILGKYWEQTRNDYQILAIAYDKLAGQDVSTVEITCDVSGNSITNASPAGSLRIGSPLINRDTARFAYIVRVNNDGTSGTLSNDLDGSTSTDYYVIHEVNQSKISPALTVQVTRTALPVGTTGP